MEWFIGITTINIMWWYKCIDRSARYFYLYLYSSKKYPLRFKEIHSDLKKFPAIQRNSQRFKEILVIKEVERNSKKFDQRFKEIWNLRNFFNRILALNCCSATLLVYCILNIIYTRTMTNNTWTINPLIPLTPTSRPTPFVEE